MAESTPKSLLQKLFKYSPNSLTQKEIDEKLDQHRKKIKKSDYLHNNYYHPSITRIQAEKLLVDYYRVHHTDGCFLVRQKTSSTTDYVLSIIRDAQFSHYVISHKFQACYYIGEDPIINGIDKLIETYQQRTDLSFKLSQEFIRGHPLPFETKIYGKKNLLHEAVAEIRAIKKLKLILNSPNCPDINERDEEGRTALDIACEYDNVEAIKELMKKKASTNVRALDGYTPLHRAAENNSMYSIDYLLSSTDADPTVRVIETGFVPLHIAALNNNLYCVKILLKYNLPDKPRSNDNKTPLDIAIEHNCDETVEFLKEYKPRRPTAKSEDWLHNGNVSREAAHNLLFEWKNEEDECVFLVRRSTKHHNQYVLSILTLADEFLNYEIIYENKLYYLKDGPYFSSLEHLIEYYLKYKDGFCLKNGKAVSSKYFDESNDYEEINVKETLSTDVSCKLEKQLSISERLTQNKETTPLKRSFKAVELKEDDITIDALIGEGEFSTVFKGTLKRSRLVAIKLLKDSSASKEFLNEVKIFQKLENHPNIVRTFGVISTEKKLMIVEELLVSSLIEKLKETPRTITEYYLKKWAFEILSGMEHMESKKILHRDLAARNILLGPNLEAKISDFGLSRAYEGDEYTQQTDSKIPIKWYAPESIERCRFTSKSDVWSFGVTLWEMWSYGEVPYGDKNGAEVYYYIKCGKRLEKPTGCPENIYSLMNKCWEWNETIRPSFKDIKLLLNNQVEFNEYQTFNIFM